MLYFDTEYNGNWKQNIWHVGEPVPIMPLQVRYVIEVQADGDELDYLTARFPFIAQNRPQQESGKANGSWDFTRMVRWYGDDARFIIGNLT